MTDAVGFNGGAKPQGTVEIQVTLTDEDILDGIQRVLGENPGWNTMIVPRHWSHVLIGKIKALGLTVRFEYDGEDL